MKNKIYQTIRHIPAYQRILLLCGYSKEKFDEMDDWEEQEMKTIKEAKEHFVKITMPETKKQEKEFVKEMMENEDIKKTRLDFLEKQEEDLEDLIVRALEHNKKMKEQFNDPIKNLHWLRLAIMNLWNLPKLERQLKKIVFEQRLIKYGEEIKQGQINEAMIAKAKEFPFEQLIETNKRGMAFCPFHNEKTPSFYIKNNWGYCFGCGKSFDTIQFLIERDNMNFIDVVKKLQ